MKMKVWVGVGTVAGGLSDRRAHTFRAAQEYATLLIPETFGFSLDTYQLFFPVGTAYFHLMACLLAQNKIKVINSVLSPGCMMQEDRPNASIIVFD